jgi:hypothetical protein
LPSQNALLILAEFGRDGVLEPSLRGDVLRAGEARRLGLAMLRDCVEKAHHCAGFDPIVAYFPPDRRGEVEEALGSRVVWAEPSAGARPGSRAEGMLRHAVSERTYKAAVALRPAYLQLARQTVFDAARALRGRAGFAFGTDPEGRVGLVGARGEVPAGIGVALESPSPAEALAAAGEVAGRPAARVDLPARVDSEEALARAVFDLRAAIATREVSGDDIPAHTLELFDALGLVASLKGDGAVSLRRAGPPRRDG